MTTVKSKFESRKIAGDNILDTRSNHHQSHRWKILEWLNFESCTRHWEPQPSSKT
jgi:hypothetical protein